MNRDLVDAKNGDRNAQYILGVCYANGYEGVGQDDEQAVYWYTEAAEQGLREAQNNLGYHYHDGKGVSKSDKQAADWYTKAAEQGYATAQYNLGMYYTGAGQDQEKAAYWYTKAAKQDDTQIKYRAQYNLGLCYLHGWGVSKDVAEAINSFTKVAKQNDDIDEAIIAKKKLKQLAEEGDADVQKALAVQEARDTGKFFGAVIGGIIGIIIGYNVGGIISAIIGGLIGGLILMGIGGNIGSKRSKGSDVPKKQA